MDVFFYIELIYKKIIRIKKGKVSIFRYSFNLWIINFNIKLKVSVFQYLSYKNIIKQYYQFMQHIYIHF